MQSCDRIRSQLPHYAVGATRGRTRRRVESHLAVCSACRAEFAALERTGALLTRVGPESAPARTWEAVHREILARPRQSALPPARRAWRLAVGLVSLFILIFGGVLLQTYRSTPQLIETPTIASDDDDTRSSVEANLSAQWSTPLADEAAVGLRMANLERGQ